MKHIRWQILLGILLVVLSALFYFFHYLIFHDAHHIFIFLVGDIAFVPIEVLLVTMIIHKLLEEREKSARLEKLNMVIEIFFSKMGTGLLTCISDADPTLENIRKRLIISKNWSDREFMNTRKQLKEYSYSIEIKKLDLQALRTFLIDKRDFILRLLENPTMLEHETFTDLIRAVLHLTEELSHRDNITKLPDTDYDHLAGDAKRAYSLLVYEWIQYMKYLKNNYPYLFSLAMRTNPFDSTASAVVQ